jgi:purine catabolism regulator
MVLPQPETGAPDHALITVKAALRLPALRVGAPEVLAGARNLDRAIRWVHVGEVRNIAALLKGGELLLTTGIAAGRTAAQQRSFVDTLKDRGVAALVVELGQHFQQIPAAMVSQAETRGLPLIALHREIPFIEVTEAVHANIVSRQLAALRRGEEIHHRFTELMIDGAGIPEILAALAETIANPVVLEKARQGVLYHAVHRIPSADVMAAFVSLALGSDAGDRVNGSAAADSALAVAVPAPGGSVWGRLIALSLDSPLDEFARVAVERAVELVALSLLRGRQEDLLSVRERGNFLADLAAGRLRPADAAHRSEGLGFHLRAGVRLMPMAIAVRRPPGGSGLKTPPPGEAGWTPVWESVVGEMRSRAIPILVGPRMDEGDVLMLIGLSAVERRHEVADAVADAVLAAVARQFGEGAPDAIVLAAGPPVVAWDDLAVAFNETAEAAALARQAAARLWHDATTPDVDRLLARLQGNPDLRTFVDQRLLPLVDHDSRRSSKLLPTLEALLEHEGRKAETARVLHLERQSLYHRIQRIETLLNADLGDPDTRLGLHLAVRARRHLFGAGTDAQPRR